MLRIPARGEHQGRQVAPGRQPAVSDTQQPDRTSGLADGASAALSGSLPLAGVPSVPGPSTVGAPGTVNAVAATATAPKSKKAPVMKQLALDEVLNGPTSECAVLRH